MTQTILALVRPKLKLSQKFNQAAHLAEHIWLDQERLKSIGLTDELISQSVLFMNGYTSELYAAEYYILNEWNYDRVKAVLFEHRMNLALDVVNYEAIKRSLAQELRGMRSAVITLAEQYERAVYTPDSPALRQPWFDDTSIVSLTPDSLQEIINEHGQSCFTYELNFNGYRTEKLGEIERNLLKDNRRIELVHPHQPPESALVSMLLPYELTNENCLVTYLYLLGLSDHRYGVIPEILRYQNGLIYDCDVFYHHYARAISINFNCADRKIDECLKRVFEALRSRKLENNFPFLCSLYSNDLALSWGDTRNRVLLYIEEALLSSITHSPRGKMTALASLTSESLGELAQLVANDLSSHGLTVVRRFGAEVE